MANITPEDAQKAWADNTDPEKWARRVKESAERGDYSSEVEDAGNESYTTGVAGFLSAGGESVSPDDVNDFDWESETLAAEGDWAKNSQSDKAKGKYGDNTGEDESEDWLSQYKDAMMSE